jgi:hypothetical protein
VGRAGEKGRAGRITVVIGGALLALSVGLGGCVGLVTVPLGLSSTPAGGPAGHAAGSGAVRDPAVPAAWESLDQQAAATCPGLSWAVLAAIGRLESDSGRSGAPGVASGANADGAEGPMQFQAATFAAYATVGPGGTVPPSPYDPVDAVYTAARMLCSDGAGSPGTLAGAVFDYDHDPIYVDTVLVLADSLLDDPALPSVPATAIAYAAAQLGVPYRWGGEGPGGFDCSGLTQAAYRSAGVSLPRVAQDQFGAGPPAPAGRPAPGDLVFFGRSTAQVGHVGLVVADGLMIDAPHTGAVVRVEPFPTEPGAPWGSEVYLGATEPVVAGG